MPIATPEIYAEMLDRAKSGGFAYPAINVTSSETVNAALRGFRQSLRDAPLGASKVLALHRQVKRHGILRSRKRLTDEPLVS